MFIILEDVFKRFENHNQPRYPSATASTGFDLQNAIVLKTSNRREIKQLSLTDSDRESAFSMLSQSFK
jgi:hypothetical protein